MDSVNPISDAPLAPTYHYKVVLLGEAAVGKSCMVVRFAKNQFFPQQEPTIGAAFMAQVVQVNGVSVRLEIWDTAGSERYRSVASMYYRGAAAAIVVYDICSESSFEGAQHWVNELHTKHSVDVLIAFVGNKIDMEEERVVETFRAKQYAEKNKLLFFETSAKTGDHVVDVFKEIASRLVEVQKLQNPNAGFQLSNPSVQSPTPLRKRIWSCCVGE